MSAMLDDAERLARLRLARTEQVGPVAFSQLLARHGSAQAALEALPAMARRNGVQLNPCPLNIAEAELARGDKLGARLVVLGDNTYPRQLAAVDPPPPLLWTLGDAQLLSSEQVAVVGARVASAGGQRIARGLSDALVRSGRTVTSGLARGIDAAAHLGTLEAGGGTVAVLGGGIDDVYPPDNVDLYRRIAAEGCIVSESPVGARAQARDFPRRNRIISGLSRGVVVVEAELRSGSLITARQANEQGRDVFAVPGSPLDPRSHGVNDLIRNGAILCEGISDIERAFEAPHRIAEPPQEMFADDAVDQDLIERVASLLSPTPTPRDELARATGTPVGMVTAALLELSLINRATLHPGGLASC